MCSLDKKIKVIAGNNAYNCDLTITFNFQEIITGRLAVLVESSLDVFDIYFSMKNRDDAYEDHEATSVITIITHYVQLSVLIVVIMITTFIRSSNGSIIIIIIVVRSVPRFCFERVAFKSRDQDYNFPNNS